MVEEIRHCPIHGLTEFHYYERKTRSGQWKCLKCESETAVVNKLKYKLKAVEYKGGKCQICGYNKNIAALEFHHIDPSQKDFGISETRHNWEDTQKELDKCIMICANCHREIHNPESTFISLNKLINLHQETLEIKQIARPRKIYKYTLEDLNNKREELGTWQAVADYYQVNISTIKRHRKELEKLERQLNG